MATWWRLGDERANQWRGRRPQILILLLVQTVAWGIGSLDCKNIIFKGFNFSESLLWGTYLELPGNVTDLCNISIWWRWEPAVKNLYNSHNDAYEQLWTCWAHYDKLDYHFIISQLHLQWGPSGYSIMARGVHMIYHLWAVS